MVSVLTGAVVAGLIAVKAYNYLDGRNLMLDMWDQHRLSARTLAAWDAFWARNTTCADIVVCMTTTPSRIGHIAGTLKSLLYQTRKPKRIRLHIPAFSKREGRPYAVPEWIAQLQSVEVIRCQDYGPATKLIPALHHLNSDQKIVVVDDDKLYPSDMIDHFFRWSRECPEIAIGSSGWIVPGDLTDRPTTLIGNLRQMPPTPIKSTRIKQKRRIDILQGYSGYLVKPRFLDVERIANYAEAPEAAFFVDDVWISAHCAVPKYVFPARRFCFEPWRNRGFFKKTSLGLLNRGEGDPERRNNTIMIRYFKDRWMINERM